MQPNTGQTHLGHAPATSDVRSLVVTGILTGSYFVIELAIRWRQFRCVPSQTQPLHLSNLGSGHKPTAGLQAAFTCA
jgi:hypothetical protein